MELFLTTVVNSRAFVMYWNACFLLSNVGVECNVNRGWA